MQVDAYGGLNVHMHVVVLDGVFARDPDHGVVSHAAPPPTLVELEAIVRRNTWGRALLSPSRGSGCRGFR